MDIFNAFNLYFRASNFELNFLGCPMDTNPYNILPTNITPVNVYVALPVFTPVAGSSYPILEQNGGAQYVNSEFGRYFHFCWC